jgi:hypothetical protein
MARVDIKYVVRLLLIITMVIQPLAFSYAMASMDISHHGQAMIDHAESGQTMNDDMMGHHDHKGHSGLDHCCQSAACGAAVVANIVTISGCHVSQRIRFSAFSVKDIDRPIEIRPPRIFPG